MRDVGAGDICSFAWKRDGPLEGCALLPPATTAAAAAVVLLGVVGIERERGRLLEDRAGWRGGRCRVPTLLWRRVEPMHEVKVHAPLLPHR